jgi:flagellar biosynthesis protein FlhB
MADESRDDRNEPASPRRLQKAREDGEVPMARDAAMLASIAAGSLFLLACGPSLRDRLVALVRASGTAIATGRTRDLLPMVMLPAGQVAGACLAAAAAAAVALAAQTRGGFWPELALPNFKRVFGGGRLGRLFKKEVVTDLGVALVKILTLVAALWSSFRDDFVTLPALLYADTEGQLRALFHPLAHGLVKILAALAVAAGVDLAVAHLRFRKRMMMTKEEARREHREEEGDPMLRSRRRRRHREIIKGQFAVEVPRADALLVNPTHIAVALRYRPGEDRAPRVTAKGKGHLAELMRELARDNGVPIVENVLLARLLYRRVKVGRAVPAETFKAVAAVLAFVYRVLGRSPIAGARRLPRRPRARGAARASSRWRCWRSSPS